MNSNPPEKPSGSSSLGKALKVIAQIIWAAAGIVFVVSVYALTYHSPWFMALIPRNTPGTPWLLKEIGVFWVVVGIAFALYTLGDRMQKRANPDE